MVVSVESFAAEPAAILQVKHNKFATASDCELRSACVSLPAQVPCLRHDRQRYAPPARATGDTSVVSTAA